MSHVGGICSSSETIITDNSRHMVVVYDMNGNFQYSFDSDYLIYPTQIAVDNRNNIFIADDGTKKIYIFNRKGLLIRKIPMDNRLCFHLSPMGKWLSL